MKRTSLLLGAAFLALAFITPASAELCHEDNIVMVAPGTGDIYEGGTRQLATIYTTGDIQIRNSGRTTARNYFHGQWECNPQLGLSIYQENQAILRGDYGGQRHDVGENDPSIRLTFDKEKIAIIMERYPMTK